MTVGMDQMNLKNVVSVYSIFKILYGRHCICKSHKAISVIWHISHKKPTEHWFFLYFSFLLSVTFNTWKKNVLDSRTNESEQAYELGLEVRKWDEGDGPLLFSSSCNCASQEKKRGLPPFPHLHCSPLICTVGHPWGSHNSTNIFFPWESKGTKTGQKCRNNVYSFLSIFYSSVLSLQNEMYNITAL